jgi:DNA-binding transcriptional regulator/RsmH inhibitor MraZ
VTVPREARALLGKEGVAHLRGLQHVLPRAGDGELFRYVVLMTEDELKRREQAILDAADVPAEAKLQLITELNGGSAFMALDGQHRIVLPKHFVAWLELDQDVLFNSTNTTIQVWNPQHFLRWSGRDAGPVHNPQLSRFLAI